MTSGEFAERRNGVYYVVEAPLIATVRHDTRRPGKDLLATILYRCNVKHPPNFEMTCCIEQVQLLGR
jgi:hypothetical protein